ncbi:MAG: ABC transporter substrate-binding protein [Chloroflexi bacterium]|nr:MAG: ABC transporter substrate-binding protein [Chloroflexota bacterium]
MDASFTKHRLPLVLSVAATVALVLTACGSTSGAPVTATGVKGGTLIMLGAGDVDHLDTASAYYTVSYTVERAYSRQLVSYPTSSDQQKAVSIVADAATEVPSQSNGGISSDGKTYTFKIKSGVKWDTSPARQVTAQDFVLGFKRLCNPVNPVGAPSYYESTIVGFKDYCEPMLALSSSTASAIAAYIQGHEISGITTSGTDTIKFQLIQAASDFVNIVSLPFASAAPVEYLQYVPGDDTFNQHVISDGPYKVVKYDPNKELDLDRNPAWDSSTDSLRAAYVDHVKVTEGLTQDAVQQQIAAGTADMEWDVGVPTADLAQLLQSKDSHLIIGPPGTFSPYVVFNLQSPNANKAMQNVKVRQALEYAVDKVAIAQFYGGLTINQAATQILAPVDAGYQKFDLYPTPDSKGDPAKAKSMLADAGYPNGLTLNYVYRTAGNHPKIAASLQADFAKAGVTLKLVPVPPAQFYTKYLESADVSKRGVWDMAAPGWVPDWFGNNGRSIITPLFDGRTYGPGTTNYGDYNSDTVNGYIDSALSASSQADANSFWHKADMQIMQDAAVIPVLNQQTPVYYAKRIQNFVYFPFSQQGDITNVWIKS